MTTHILECDPVDDVVVEHFKNRSDCRLTKAYDRESLEASIETANVLIVRSGTRVDADLLGQANDLFGIVRAGVGLDTIDLEAAESMGIEVENTPEASTNAVAELTLGLVLDQLRGIARADAAMKRGDWIKGELDGREIQGKVAGIIGYGRIGRRVGDLLSAFGADLIAYDALLSDDEIQRHGAESVSLAELLKESDIVTVHVPLTEETRYMIDEPELNQLKDDAVLINCSRGGIYRESALQKGLEDDRIRGVGLDTYEEEPPDLSPLIEHPHTTATPLVGASTREAQERIGQLVIDKIERMID